MNSRSWVGLCVLAGAALLFIATADLLGEPPDKEADQSDPPKPKITVQEARARAKLLQITYESTLISVHRAYFEDGKRMMVPARVLEDVFYWVDQETGGETRWISVNTEAMNIDHEPESEIEKKAAKDTRFRRRRVRADRGRSLLPRQPDSTCRLVPALP